MGATSSSGQAGPQALTLTLIADEARLIRTAYAAAAARYRREAAVLAAIRSTPGMAEHEQSAFHNLVCTGRVCGEYDKRLTDLGLAVAAHLPGVFAKLRLFGNCSRWHDTPGFDWAGAETELRQIEAVALSTLAAGEAAPTIPGAESTKAVECLVTLQQAAAMVNRSKRTLERLKSKMPPPEVPGGGGKPDEWVWAALRPWLAKEFGRPLPERFPADRVRPAVG